MKEEIRFSRAVLVSEWGRERGLEPKKRKSERAKSEKANRENRSGNRKYKGMSGRISKDGATGYFDVDSRGRMICV